MPRLTSFAAAAAVFLAGSAHAAVTPERVRGTIEKLDGNTLMVQGRNGEALRIALAPSFAVSAVVPTTTDAIKPGTEIGIVGFGPPDHQRAAVISIFPAGASVSEAQFAWDSAPDSTMTNAPVVADVAAAEGHELTVTVKGRSVQVTVPPNAVVQTTEPGTRAMLVPGAKVIVFAQRGDDGSLTAARVNVGKDGFAPAN